MHDYMWVEDLAQVNLDELSTLYRIAPLGDKSADTLATVFANSTIVCFTYLDGALVGAGRALSDGRECALIADVAVHPHHQRRGLGSQIMHRILTLCGEHNKIILYAKPGTQSFYLKLGFLPMNTAMGLWRHPTRALQTGILSGAQAVDASSASP